MRTDTGSYLDEGFAAGTFVRITGAGAANGDRYVADVTDTTITLTATLSVSGTFDSVVISKLTREGLWQGAVTFVGSANAVACAPALAGCRQVTRTDGTGWLADGFLEGQRVRVCQGGTCADLKIALIRGTNATQDTTLQFTSEGAFPFAGTGSVTVTRIAAVATFSPDAAATNAWYRQQTIVLAADNNYALPPGRANVKIFPVSTHLLAKLLGPLAVEGGTTAADRSLRNGIMLPGEVDGPLFEIPAQPPESSQIDVLNVFNDSSQSDGVGTMTSTTITGFGMSTGLTFDGGTAFGEPTTFPGGISFGTITFVDGQFQTDGAKSTIEVLNVLLGQGNDRFTITGTLDPASEPYTPVTFTGAVDIAFSVGTRYTFTRRDNSAWATGTLGDFVAGQQVLIDGVAGVWRVISVSGSVLTLERGSGAPALAPATNVVRTLSVPGPHGGLTVVHGGGNTALTVSASVDVAVDRLVRRDGLAWVDDGFQVGQRITIAGSTSVWTIVGFADGACLDPDPFANCGKGSVMIVAGAALAAATDVDRAIAVVDAAEVSTTTTTTLAAASISRSAGSWVTDGFLVGMEIWISGLPGSWTITTLSATTLGLAGAPIVPASSPTVRTVFGYDREPRRRCPNGRRRAARRHLRHQRDVDVRRHAHPRRQRDLGARLRRRSTSGHPRRRRRVHDRVGQRRPPLDHADRWDAARERPADRHARAGRCARWSELAARALRRHLAGRLLVRRQPGDRRRSRVRRQAVQPVRVRARLGERGRRVDLPARQPVPRLGQRRDRRQCPVRPTRLQRHVLNLPSVGITAYGGAGDDTIVGSQTGDYLAGGSGDDTDPRTAGRRPDLRRLRCQRERPHQGPDDPVRERRLHGGERRPAPRTWP